MLLSVRRACGSCVRSFAPLLVMPTAAASVRLLLRLPAASFGRPVGFSPLRTLSAVSTPNASAADKRAEAVVAPKGAAALRALTAEQVVDFVKTLHVSQAQAEKLAAQDVDGAALLEATVDELCDRYGLNGGAAHTIMRAVEEAQSATLTIYPPKKKKSDPNQARKQSLTPATFTRMFDVLKAPLNIMNSSGSVLRVATSLAEAVQAGQEGLFLRATRSYDDDLTSLNGFQANCSTALEIKSTRALATDVALIAKYGPLKLVNSGEELTLRLPRLGEEALELKPDGLVVSATSSVVLFNSAKHTPSEDDIDQLLLDVQKLGRLLSNFAHVSTTPAAAKAQFAELHCSATAPLRIVPFLSGDNFRAFIAAECGQRGVGVVRPNGDGFVVEAGESVED